MKYIMTFFLMLLAVSMGNISGASASGKSNILRG